MAQIIGTPTGSNASAYSLWLELTINSQDVVNNISNVTIAMKGQRIDGSNSGYVWEGSTAGFGGIYVPGYVSYNAEADLGIWIDFRNQVVVTLYSWTGNVAHNADGTLTLALSGAWHNHHSVYLTGGNVSGSWTLTTIPRKSSISVPAFTVGNTAVATITRYSSTFKHKLYYSFDLGQNYTLLASDLDTTYSWDTSAIKAALYALMPTSQSKIAVFKCETYSGATLLGYSTTTCAVSINVAECTPTLSATAIDVNAIITALTGNSSVFVNHY